MKTAPWQTKNRGKLKEIGTIVRNANYIGHELVGFFMGELDLTGVSIEGDLDDLNNRFPWSLDCEIKDVFSSIELMAKRHYSKDFDFDEWRESLEIKDTKEWIQEMSVRGLVELDMYVGDISSGNMLYALFGHTGLLTLMCHIYCFVGDKGFPRRSIMARHAAFTKLANDPKQREKVFIRDCWKSWQHDLQKYPSQAAFARDMLSKCEHLTSQKKIEDWCREWKKTDLTQLAR